MSDIKINPDASDLEKGQSDEVKQMFDEVDRVVNVETTVKPQKSKKGLKTVLTVVLVAILIFVVLLIISTATNWNVLGLENKESMQNQSSDWQAVFLTNNQVYFGKLSQVEKNFVELEDIYYLQVQNAPIQPAAAAENEEGVQSAEQAQQRLILVKFGTELHRPVDRMYINRDHILMYEDLQTESNVVEAIMNYKNEGNVEIEQK